MSEFDKESWKLFTNDFLFTNKMGITHIYCFYTVGDNTNSNNTGSSNGSISGNCSIFNSNNNFNASPVYGSDNVICGSNYNSNN
jgi:hypothetical protein